MKQIYQLSALQIQELFVKGDCSAVEIAQSFLDRIERLDGHSGAFLELLSDTMLQRAHALDFKRSQKEPLGSLAAVPIGIKDNILVQGASLTCASQFLKGYQAPYQASVIENLLKEDALLIGKLNLDEFGMGSNMKNSSFGLSRNPWNFERTPGGSSGGSAAAVAGRLCPLALGTDTGGSIRQPAAFCGIYGMKPSYGSVSRWGLVAFGSSLDQIGPMAHSLDDIGLCMQSLEAPCDKDSTCVTKKSQGYLKAPSRPIETLRIGVPHHLLERLDGATRSVFQKHLERFEAQGATLIDLNLDLIRHSIAVYYIIACAEASTNLARFDGVRYGQRSKEAKNLDELYKYSKEEGFGYEVKKRILLGNFCLASGKQEAFFGKAQRVRKMIYDQYISAFEECDVVATPTTPTGAYRFDEEMDPLQVYLADIYTSPINLAGLPAISIPAGFDEQGMPLGLQLCAAPFQDLSLFQIARTLQPHCDQKPLPDHP